MVTFYNAKFGQNYSDEREPLNNKNKPNTDESSLRQNRQISNKSHQNSSKQISFTNGS